MLGCPITTKRTMAAAMFVSSPPFNYEPNNGFKFRSRAFPALAGRKQRTNGLSVSVGRNANALSSVRTSQELERRKANHHGNLWDDHFIQSLPKQNQNQAEAEGERKKLIGEVKDMFNAIATSSNLLQRLSTVDIVERLGIDRHFQDEISSSLDYVYRYWNYERGAGFVSDSSYTDLNTTALGLRILRLHRYNVSSDVLKHFQDKDGQFIFDSSGTIPQEQQITTILNLLRASHIAFPGDNVMEEAKAFSTAYLNQVLKIGSISSTLSKEIELNLEYGWYGNLPRVEARNYIDIYSQDSSWDIHAISNKTLEHMTNKRLLALAKLDFNMMQKEHLQELQNLSKWWVDSGLWKLKFARHRHVEYFFESVGICAEPKYAAFRRGLAKFSAFVTYIDDIYDTYGTLDELKLFREAVKRWDPSATDCLPEYMKIAYMALYESVNEIAAEADKAQGRETLLYSLKAWEACIDAFMQEATWISDGHIPTLDEYLETGVPSCAIRVVTLQPLLTLDAHLPEDVLSQIDYPSRFSELLGLVFRLKGDVMTYKMEAARGEVASSITCYMRDHPGCTEEEALKYVIALLDERLKELNWEYLKPDSVPTIAKDFAYSILRGLLLFYKERDGIGDATMDVKNHVTKMLFEPVNM